MKLTVNERESVKVLEECIELQKRKGEDYQSSPKASLVAYDARRRQVLGEYLPDVRALP